MGSSSVVVGFVFGQDRSQVPLAEDEYLVDELGPGGEDKSLGVGVRARTSGRDLHGFDAGAGHDRVERGGELPGPVTDQEPEVRGAVTEAYQEIADLLRGPRPFGFAVTPRMCT
jgi:hypothetical protein